jgi:transposase
MQPSTLSFSLKCFLNHSAINTLLPTIRTDAMRWNPDLKAKYEQMRATGKPAKVAIVAIMKKLIEVANALVKANRKWTPKTA